MQKIISIPTKKQKFIFLQGPHGSFFHELAQSLKNAGAEIEKIGFNQGDYFFWKDKKTYTGYHDTIENWAGFITKKLQEDCTDLVVYGDVRIKHKQAIKIAQKLNIHVHCFEEGYLRPYWATYERNGINGYSKIMKLSIAQMRHSLPDSENDPPQIPAHWGNIKSHIFLGALYHFFTLFRNSRYPHYQSHRKATIAEEFKSHLFRLFMQPYYSFASLKTMWQIRNSSNTHHIALLQLAHDASITEHSDYENIIDFIDDILNAFARSAPKHHHLIFKAHPLEDYRVRIDLYTRNRAQALGLSNRVHFLFSGKLAEILNLCKSAVTINSTAGQQALWRGLPIKTMGKAIYDKPELVSQQSLDEFYKNPTPPNIKAYRDFRRYLLITSQYSGGFYSKKSRQRLIHSVLDKMLNLNIKMEHKYIITKINRKTQRS